MSVDGTVMPKRPRGRPRGSRGKAALARAMSLTVDEGWGPEGSMSLGGGVGEGDVPPSQDSSWWPQASMGLGNSASAAGSQPKSGNIMCSPQPCATSNAGIRGNNPGFHAPLASQTSPVCDPPQSGPRGLNPDNLQARCARDRFQGVKHEQQCYTINKQDLYSQTDSSITIKSESAIMSRGGAGKPLDHPAGTRNPSSAAGHQDGRNAAHDHMFGNPGQGATGYHRHSSRSPFMHDMNLMKNSPKPQHALNEDFWSDPNQAGGDGNKTPRGLLGFQDGSLASRNSHGVSGNLTPGGSHRLGDGGAAPRGFHGNADGTMTPKSSQGDVDGNAALRSSQGGTDGSAMPRSCSTSTDQSILENILKGRIQSPLRSERSSVSSVESLHREGMRSMLSRKNSLSQYVDNSVDDFMGGEDEMQQHCGELCVS